LQLAIATLGGANANNDRLLVWSTLVLLIIIAPSPAVATSISTSTIANKAMIRAFRSGAVLSLNIEYCLFPDRVGANRARPPA
jgi:hypothetical protein